MSVTERSLAEFLYSAQFEGNLSESSKIEQAFFLRVAQDLMRRFVITYRDGDVEVDGL